MKMETLYSEALETLLYGLSGGRIHPDELSNFVFDKSERAADQKKSLDEMEASMDVLSKTVLATIYRLKMKLIDPDDSITFKTDKKIKKQGKDDGEKRYLLNEIAKIIGVSNATTLSHFYKGWLVGERESPRKTYVTHSDLITYIKNRHKSKSYEILKGLENAA